MKRLSSLLLGLVLAAAVSSGVTSCTSKSPAPSIPPVSAHSGPAQPASGSAAPVPAGAVPASSAPAAATPSASSTPLAAGKCPESLARIRALYESIPEDWRDAKDLSDLKQRVRTCIQESEAFLRDCRDAEGGHEANFFLGRLLFSENRIAWMQWIEGQRKIGLDDAVIVQGREKWAAEYFGRVADLANRAAEKSEKGSVLRLRSLDVHADSLYQMGQHEKALEKYRAILEEQPNYEQKSRVYLAMINSLDALGRQDEGIQLARKAMTELGEDPLFPSFLEALWKLNSSKGDLDGLLKVVEEMRSTLPVRLQRAAVTARERDSAERSLNYSGFRLGYAKFALGDFPGALAAFSGHITDLNELEKRLTEAKKPFPQDLGVYRDMRSKDNLEVLESKIGTRVNADFRSALWATGRRPTLDGRVQAILFRNYGDERSAPFLQGLDRACREQKEAFELFAISFLKGSEDPEAQIGEVVREANALEIQCPVGLDPDAKEKSMFDAFGATVGSATFVVIDREGKYVWFQQDPRPIDVKFSLAIVDRVMKK